MFVKKQKNVLSLVFLNIFDELRLDRTFLGIQKV